MILSSQILEMRQGDCSKSTCSQTVLAVAAERRFDKYRIPGIDFENCLNFAHQTCLAGIACLAEFPIHFWFIQIYEPPPGRLDCAA